MSTQFDEIVLMKKLVEVLTPVLRGTLGEIDLPQEDPDNPVPLPLSLYLQGQSDKVKPNPPSVSLSYGADAMSHPIDQRGVTIEGATPEDDVHRIETDYLTKFSVSFQVDVENMEEVLRGNRTSPNKINRTIRAALRRQSIRDQVFEATGCGINSIVPNAPVMDVEGNEIVTQALIQVLFTVVDTDIEEVAGVIETIESRGTLYKTSEEVVDINTDRDVEDPNKRT
ncbi:hypothetical protein [Vibrio phage RYC]|nr:hypothetical protein [Vibrio phage RYC]